VKPVVLDGAPPPKRSVHRGRVSKYAPLIDFALEHEGQWIKAGLKAPAKRVHSVATAVRSVAGSTVKRLGLRGAFEVVERADESGQLDVYLRKLPRGEAAS
jgi:hypothetical protein